MNWKLCFVSALLMGISGCKSDVKKENDEKKKSPKAIIAEPEVVYDRYWNDMASFLAGIKPNPGSVFDSIVIRPEFIQLQKYMDKAWKIKEDSLLRKLQDWSAQEFPTEHQEAGTVFYPFSGPDFMTIHTLFPKAKKYIFFGLEREGVIPDTSKINHLKPIQLDKAVRNIKYSLRSIMDLTFFVTKEMQSDFLRSDFNGALPIILAFMARTGNEVLDIKPIIIAKNTKTSEINTHPPKKFQDFDPRSEDITGVRILFRAKKGQPVQELEYFSIDVEDQYMKKHPQVVDYIMGHKPTNSYAKAASYLMHYDIFTTIRNTVLNTTKFMLQDDSGIAYRFFDKEAWNFSYYGKYDKPKHMFSWCYQPVLKKIYTTDASVKNIDFGLGYTSGKHNCNLMIARKKAEINLPTDLSLLPEGKKEKKNEKSSVKDSTQQKD